MLALPSSTPNIAEALSSQTQKERLDREVCVLTSLILVMPVPNAVSERSFSALRRIKSYLRATMSQERLNHIYVFTNT